MNKKYGKIRKTAREWENINSSTRVKLFILLDHLRFCFFFSARFSARFLCFDVILYYPILCEHIYIFFKFNPRIQFIRFLWLDHQNHVQPTEISSSTAYQTILAYVFAYSSRRYYIDCQSQRLSHLNIRSDSQLREFYPEN